MKRMKVLLILALLLVGVIFSLHADIAKNIQGNIEVWNGYEWERAANENVTVILYKKLLYGGGVYDEADIYTNDNGTYSHDFNDPYNNWEECDRVEVIFRSCSYYSSYDGIERIDIWWFQPF